MSRRHTPRSDDDDDGIDDGSDPVRYHDRRRRHATASGDRPGRKALQLCGQVRDTLTTALAGSADDGLRALTVTAVEPAPNAGRLLVLLSAGGDAKEIEARVHRAAGWLRTEVAAGITRRAVPELAFRVAGDGGADAQEPDA